MNTINLEENNLVFNLSLSENVKVQLIKQPSKSLLFLAGAKLRKKSKVISHCDVNATYFIFRTNYTFEIQLKELSGRT